MNPRIMKKVSKRLAEIDGFPKGYFVDDLPFAEDIYYDYERDGMTAKQKRRRYMSRSTINNCYSVSDYDSYIGDGDTFPLAYYAMRFACVEFGELREKKPGDGVSEWDGDCFEMIPPKFRPNAKHVIALAKKRDEKRLKQPPRGALDTAIYCLRA